jgi:WhiB family redox-sensing transcriptional regulator
MSIIGEAASIANREQWVDHALCAQIDCGDLFFPDKGGAARPAISVCMMCPVRAKHLGGSGECLDYAIRTNQLFGIWGGVGERARRQMKRLKRTA